MSHLCCPQPTRFVCTPSIAVRATMIPALENGYCAGSFWFFQNIFQNRGYHSSFSESYITGEIRHRHLLDNFPKSVLWPPGTMGTIWGVFISALQVGLCHSGRPTCKEDILNTQKRVLAVQQPKAGKHTQPALVLSCLYVKCI